MREALLDLMAALGLRQRDLAHLAGVSEPTLSKAFASDQAFADFFRRNPEAAQTLLNLSDPDVQWALLQEQARRHLARCLARWLDVHSTVARDLAEELVRQYRVRVPRWDDPHPDARPR
ncbi:helix-turn-helix domain-containing protein [Calidithermus terrae]|nr:helix-turn-helix transcriptional regulator [Calidithermus terrae]